jgi:hypothetical protein
MEPITQPSKVSVQANGVAPPTPKASRKQERLEIRAVTTDLTVPTATVVSAARLLVGAVGIEPSSLLKTGKLFILRSDRLAKIARNAELKYTT